MSATRIRVAAAVLSVVAIGLPAFVFWRSFAEAPTGVSTRNDVPAVDTTPSEQERYAAAAAGDRLSSLHVLSYHDVRPGEGSEFSVTPEEFAAHMAMLDDSGFRVVGLADMARYLRGEEPPPGAVLVTFDDGTRGTWTWADPILERHGFEAANFVITGSVDDRPYYLSWAEMREMSRSGRWGFGAHSHEGHVRVPVDADGGRSPALANRAWLADAERLETLTEVEARVAADIERSLDAFSQHDIAVPEVFAYPFSATAQASNDVFVPPLVDDLLRDAFRATFINVKPPRPVTPSDLSAGEIPRIEVFRGTTSLDLLDALEGSAPRDPAAFGDGALTAGDWWSNLGHASEAKVGRDGLRFPAVDGSIRAHLSPFATAHWDRYEAATLVTGLGRPGDGATASLVVLAGSNDEVQVGVSAGWVRVRAGRASNARIVTEGEIAPADAHSISVEVGERVRVRVDGELVATVDHDDGHGGVGLAVFRDTPAAPTPTFRTLTLH